MAYVQAIPPFMLEGKACKTKTLAYLIQSCGYFSYVRIKQSLATICIKNLFIHTATLISTLANMLLSVQLQLWYLCNAVLPS